MDVVRHDDVAEDLEAVLFPCLFEDFLEGISGFFCVQDEGVTMTADGDEVKVTGLLESFEAGWHDGSLEESGWLRQYPTLYDEAVKDGPPVR